MRIGIRVRIRGDMRRQTVFEEGKLHLFHAGRVLKFSQRELFVERVNELLSVSFCGLELRVLFLKLFSCLC